MTADGIALGVVPAISLEDVTVNVEPGDFLILYTDGVTEAMNAAMEEFGAERLQEVVRRQATGNAQELVDAIVAAVDVHTEEMPMWDDFTLVVAKRLS